MKIIITESQKNTIINNSNWSKVNNKLIKTFNFKDYVEVMAFVNKVMKIADKQNHHPDMSVYYDKVKLSITDHDKGKVSGYSLNRFADKAKYREIQLEKILNNE